LAVFGAPQLGKAPRRFADLRTERGFHSGFWYGRSDPSRNAARDPGRSVENNAPACFGARLAARDRRGQRLGVLLLPRLEPLLDASRAPLHSGVAVPLPHGRDGERYAVACIVVRAAVVRIKRYDWGSAWAQRCSWAAAER
jgi:hypothetical protein